MGGLILSLGPLSETFLQSHIKLLIFVLVNSPNTHTSIKFGQVKNFSFVSFVIRSNAVCIIRLTSVLCHIYKSTGGESAATDYIVISGWGVLPSKRLLIQYSAVEIHSIHRQKEGECERK